MSVTARSSWRTSFWSKTMSSHLPTAASAATARGSTTPARRGRRRRLDCSAHDADELCVLVRSGERLLDDDADSRAVDLLVVDSRFHLRRLERRQHVANVAVRNLDRSALAGDPCSVLGFPGQVLLTVAVRDLRAGFHDDARLGAVDARLPRAGGVGLPVPQVRGGVLAQIPDVALLVLSEPVERL